MDPAASQPLFQAFDHARTALEHPEQLDGLIGPQIFYAVRAGLDPDALFLETIARAEQIAERQGTKPLRHTRRDPGIYTLHAEQAGESVVLLGGVHGNEPSGVFAILGILHDLKSGACSLKRGSVTLVLGNPDAFVNDERPIGLGDMNRNFPANERLDPDSPLAKRMAQVRSALGPFRSVLDLHSLSADSPPFTLCGRTREGDALLVPTEHVVSLPFSMQRLLKGSIQAFAAQFQTSLALSVECGRHDAPETYLFAYRAAHEFLEGVGVVQREQGAAELPASRRFFGVFHVEQEQQRLRPGESGDFNFAREFRGFDELHKGELIGRYEIQDGSGSTRQFECWAPEDCVIVMPARGENLRGDKYFLARPYVPPAVHVRDFRETSFWPQC